MCAPTRRLCATSRRLSRRIPSRVAAQLRLTSAGPLATPHRSFSPTDRKFCTASDDGSVGIIDFYTQKVERKLKGHGSDVRCAAWHPSKGGWKRRGGAPGTALALSALTPSRLPSSSPCFSRHVHTHQGSSSAAARTASSQSNYGTRGWTSASKRCGCRGGLWCLGGFALHFAFLAAPLVCPRFSHPPPPRPLAPFFWFPARLRCTSALSTTIRCWPSSGMPTETTP